MIRIKTPMMFVVFMTFIGLNAGGTSVYGQYMDDECEWIFSPVDFYEGSGAGTSGICSADFNGDGTLDVAIANRNLHNVMVFSNDGLGQFSLLSTTPICHGFASKPRYVVCGDFDGDGDIDAATANWDAHCEHCEEWDPPGYEGGSLTVLLNDGSGVFTVTEEHLLLRAACLDVADLNGDGILDLIVAHWVPEVGSSGPGIATVFRGIGDGTFEEVAYVAVGNLPRGIDVGDLDNDGDIDFAVSNMGNLEGGHSVTVVENLGNFNFAVRSPLLEGTTPRFLAIGDVTGDGLSDISVVHKEVNTMLVYKNEDDFNFSLSLFDVYPTADNPHSIAVADIDGDCSLDLIVSHVGAPPPYFVYLYRNNRSGVFEKTEIESLHQPAHVITADVNDDGKPDVLTACVSGGYFNVHMSEVAQIGCTDACFADINHDGVVSVEDFLIIISNWGQEGFSCRGDIDGNGAVNVADLLIMLNNFGGECDPEERSLTPPQLDDSAPRPRRRR